jgi:adenylate cyclase
VAARLQAECPPGGICVSRAVRDHVHGRLDLVFDDLGALSLKNIARPVEAFLLRLTPAAIEPRLLSSVPLHSNVRKARPPRLSVIVTPLRNLGVPKEHEYLLEAITEDISTDLPQYMGPFVVVSDALRRDGDPASPRDIARELGVGYVIQGSARGIVDRVALNLQLMDVETGVHLWSERFDFDLGGTTDPRNEVTNRVTATLFQKLITDVSHRIEALPPKDWSPDDFVIRGIALSFLPVTAQISSDPNRQESLRCFEQALAKAPDSISAKIGIASILTVNVAVGRSPSGGPDGVRAEQLLTDVLGVNGQIAIAHTLMGLLRRSQSRLDDSLVELKVAIGLAPNDPWTIAHLGITLAFLGDPDAAIPFLERSLRLSANQSLAPISHGHLGLCHLLLGNTKEAISSLRTGRAINPRMSFIHWWLAAALGLKGELDEAVAALRQALEMDPLLLQSVMLIRRRGLDFVSLYEKTVYAGLRRAGLPDVWAGTEEPPLGWIGNPERDSGSRVLH